ncbi:MAG: transposase [Coriobacteriaceae bacterium]
MNNRYEHGNHSKYLLRYHFILATNYRRKTLTDPTMITDVKQLSTEIVTRGHVSIPYMETDKGHIHYMI